MLKRYCSLSHYYFVCLVALRTFQAKALRKFSERFSKMYDCAIDLQQTQKLQLTVVNS